MSTERVTALGKIENWYKHCARGQSNLQELTVRKQDSRLENQKRKHRVFHYTKNKKLKRITVPIPCVPNPFIRSNFLFLERINGLGTVQERMNGLGTHGLGTVIRSNIPFLVQCSNTQARKRPAGGLEWVTALEKIRNQHKHFSRGQSNLQELTVSKQDSGFENQKRNIELEYSGGPEPKAGLGKIVNRHEHFTREQSNLQELTVRKQDSRLENFDSPHLFIPHKKIQQLYIGCN